jgi:hypothetical protein
VARRAFLGAFLGAAKSSLERRRPSVAGTEDRERFAVAGGLPEKEVQPRLDVGQNSAGSRQRGARRSSHQGDEGAHGPASAEAGQDHNR